MAAPGIPIVGMMVGAMGKNHEEGNTFKAQNTQGAKCWRLLQKGGHIADTTTGKMAVRRRPTARYPCSSHQPPTGGAHSKMPGITGVTMRAVIMAALFLFKEVHMDSHVIEKISNPIQEISLPKPNQSRVVRTKVVGVSFDNRQEVIARMHRGDRIWLDMEPDNPYDPNAISVCCSSGLQIGYLNRNIAARLISLFRAYGYPVKGKVAMVTGSEWDGYNLGVVISFKLPKNNQLNNNLHFEDWDDWKL
jgi:hypothetical protein